MTSDARAEAMAARGEFFCPAWCAQPDDEHEYAAHLSAYATYTTTAGVVVQARAAMGWADETSLDGVHAEVSHQALILTERDTDSIADLLTTTFGRVSHARIYLDPGTWQWAYPGAGDEDEEDEEDGDEECCGDEEDTCHDCPILMVPR